MFITCTQTDSRWPYYYDRRPPRGPQDSFRPPIVPGMMMKAAQHSKEGEWRLEAPVSRARNGDTMAGRMQDRASRQHYVAEELVAGIPYSKEGYRGSARLYSVEVTETDARFLNVMTNGGRGDVDIYVRFDNYPTKRTYDERSAHDGNQEQVIINNPKQGRYYIVLYGFDEYYKVGFEAEYR